MNTNYRVKQLIQDRAAIERELREIDESHPSTTKLLDVFRTMIEFELRTAGASVESVRSTCGGDQAPHQIIFRIKDSEKSVTLWAHEAQHFDSGIMGVAFTIVDECFRGYVFAIDFIRAEKIHVVFDMPYVKIIRAIGEWLGLTVSNSAPVIELSGFQHRGKGAPN